MESTTEPADATGSFGFGQRRPRLSDEETERRMLQTAAEMVTRSGLTVSLEHIRLEDVIREAGVSRSAVYRRWPHKDLFLGDLLLKLASAQAPMAATGGRETTAVIRDLVVRNLDRLASPGERLRLGVELLRETAWQDFQHIFASRDWRTYLALTVTFAGLPPGRLRERVQQALAASERAFADRIARNIQAVAELLGFRLRPGLPASFETVAHLSNALARGLVTKALITPDLASRRVTGELHGCTGEWSLPALGVVAIFMTYLEPDPHVVWDQARITRVRERLAASDDLFATG